MMPENIEKFVQDVSKMRDAQNVYFKLRKDKNAPKEDVWAAYNEAKRLERIVDEQLKEQEPNLFNS